MNGYRALGIVFGVCLVGTLLGIAAGVGLSLHDTHVNQNNLFGHWFPAIITGAVGAALGGSAGLISGIIATMWIRRGDNKLNGHHETS